MSDPSAPLPPAVPAALVADLGAARADIVFDMISAYKSDCFDWSTGAFHLTRKHNVGSLGWPWEFRHSWTVRCTHQTRDALIRDGYVEVLPDNGMITGGGRYRLALKALNYATSFMHDTPSFKAFLVSRDQEEREMRAGSHHTRTV